MIEIMITGVRTVHRLMRVPGGIIPVSMSSLQVCTCQVASVIRQVSAGVTHLVIVVITHTRL